MFIIKSIRQDKCLLSRPHLQQEKDIRSTEMWESGRDGEKTWCSLLTCHAYWCVTCLSYWWLPAFPFLTFFFSFFISEDPLYYLLVLHTSFSYFYSLVKSCFKTAGKSSFNFLRDLTEQHTSALLRIYTRIFFFFNTLKCASHCHYFR